MTNFANPSNANDAPRQGSDIAGQGLVLVVGASPKATTTTTTTIACCRQLRRWRSLQRTSRHLEVHRRLWVRRQLATVAARWKWKRLALLPWGVQQQALVAARWKCQYQVSQHEHVLMAGVRQLRDAARWK